MSQMKKVILKPIQIQKGFIIDDELYSECAKRLGAEISNEAIAHIIAAFLEKYEEETICYKTIH